MGEVTGQDTEMVRDFLITYKKIKAVIVDLDKNETPEKLEKNAFYQLNSKRVGLIDRAIELLQDDTVKRIVERRFVLGLSRSEVVLYFSGLYYTDRTIDRKIKQGIVLITEIIKSWEQLECFERRYSQALGNSTRII